MGTDIEDFANKLDISLIKDALANVDKKDIVECPVNHHFSDGVYTRETFMPKGTFALGKKHRFKTINIIAKGKLSIYNGENSPILHVEAPYTFVSDAGVQKMAYFHEDTVWLNCHPTSSTDLEEIESIFIDSDTKDILEEGE